MRIFGSNFWDMQDWMFDEDDFVEKLRRKVRLTRRMGGGKFAVPHIHGQLIQDHSLGGIPPYTRILYLYRLNLDAYPTTTPPPLCFALLRPEQST